MKERFHARKPNTLSTPVHTSRPSIARGGRRDCVDDDLRENVVVHIY
jgi:hypothetical protein